MKMHSLLLAGIAAASLSSLSAGAVVLTTNWASHPSTDSPLSLNVFGGDSFGPLFGQISIRVDLGFVIADGARNGAVLGLSSAPSAPTALFTVSTKRSGTSETAELQIGTPQNFTGAGGSPGEVTIVVAPEKNFSSSPKTSTSNQPGGAVSGDARALHVSGAGIAFDGNAGDGAEIQLGVQSRDRQRYAHAWRHRRYRSSGRTSADHDRFPRVGFHHRDRLQLLQSGHARELHHRSRRRGGGRRLIGGRTRGAAW